MKYNFDFVPNRRATFAEKWKNIPDDVISMGIADMEFSLLPEVREAVKRTVDRGDFGYIGMQEKDYDAVIEWIKKRRGYDVPREHIISTPGVLYAARTALHTLTAPGDKVIVQTPLHTPSITSASLLGRIPLENRLIYENGKYRIDYDNLEECFKSGAKVLMMCAPHNPTGRVWTKEELLRVGEIVKRYNGYIISDEIHSDIVWGENKHISPSQIPDISDRTVAVFSTSKTFNMGGFHIGTAIIPNAELREKIVKQFYSYGHVCDRPTVLCIAAQTAAYTYGEGWLSEMLAYVENNFKLTLEYLSGLPIEASHPEGTFLLWADITKLGLNADELKDVMFNKWKVVCDPGSYYDSKDYALYHGPEHHIRFNLALPRTQLEDALERIRKNLK